MEPHSVGAGGGQWRTERRTGPAATTSSAECFFTWEMLAFRLMLGYNAGDIGDSVGIRLFVYSDTSRLRMCSLGPANFADGLLECWAVNHCRQRPIAKLRGCRSSGATMVGWSPSGRWRFFHENSTTVRHARRSLVRDAGENKNSG